MNEREGITTDLPKTKRIIRKCKLYVNKLDNVHEMEKFLERHTPLKLTKEIKYLNSSITSKETELVIKKLIAKILGPDRFTDKFYQTLKEEELKTILHKLFQKTKEEGTLPNTLYEVSITLIPNQRHQKKKKS